MSESDVARIKQKVMGVRMRSTRVQLGLDIAAAAKLLGISPSHLNAIELGEQETSLPELEALARIYAVPVTYFWSNGADPAPLKQPNTDKRLAIRGKIIGVLLTQARQRAGHAYETVAEVVGCSVEQIERYELGDLMIPFSDLEKLAAFFELPLEHFLEQSQVVTHQQSATEESALAIQEKSQNIIAEKPTPPSDVDWLVDVPDDVKQFLSDPSSLLYLRLSMRLHDLSADTLRTLAEGILDITY